MTQEIDNKRQQLLDMTEHPDRYSEEELKALLQDPEMQDFLRMLAMTKRAADPHLKDEADVDREWERFAAAHHQHRFTRIAAAVAGGVLVTGLAVAAVVKLGFFPSNNTKPAAQQEQTTVVKPSATDSAKTISTTAADTLSVAPKVYDDVALHSILADMAAFYHKKVKTEKGANTDVRLYFVWNQSKTLEENINLLNNFNRFEITVEGASLWLPSSTNASGCASDFPAFSFSPPRNIGARP